MARRLDSESEKMANFFRLERRIISRERLRATSSAVKMLAWLLMRMYTVNEQCDTNERSAAKGI